MYVAVLCLKKKTPDSLAPSGRITLASTQSKMLRIDEADGENKELWLSIKIMLMIMQRGDGGGDDDDDDKDGGGRVAGWSWGQFQ